MGVVLCCLVLNHQFLYFARAALHASAAADSSSCVRDGTRWRALETAAMQPLWLNKGLRCCHVKAIYPRRAILHRGRILHNYAPQTRSTALSRRSSKRRTQMIVLSCFSQTWPCRFPHMRIFISGFIASWESPTVIYKNSNGR